jgi:hypothetical protein
MDQGKIQDQGRIKWLQKTRVALVELIQKEFTNAAKYTTNRGRYERCTTETMVFTQ